MNKRNQGGHGSAYIFDGAVNVALFGPKGGSVRTQAISVEAAESLIADLQKAVQEAKGEPAQGARVFLAAYDGADGPYACAFSTAAKADAFARQRGGVFIDSFVDTHADMIDRPGGPERA